MQDLPPQLCPAPTEGTSAAAAAEPLVSLWVAGAAQAGISGLLEEKGKEKSQMTSCGLGVTHIPELDHMEADAYKVWLHPLFLVTKHLPVLFKGSV